jgi:hypothetical protein
MLMSRSNDLTVSAVAIVITSMVGQWNVSTINVPTLSGSPFPLFPFSPLLNQGQGVD